MPQDREVLSHLWRWSGLGALTRRLVARRRVSILVYHDPSPAVVDRHLRWLSRHYSFIDLETLVGALETGNWIAIPDYALVVTLDDGHRGNFLLRDVFTRHGVRPTVYACPGVIEGDGRFWFRRLSRKSRERLKRLHNQQRLALAPFDPGGPRQALRADELRALADTWAVGSHTRSHPVLTTCTTDEAREEIAGSKADLAAMLGRPCEHFCYPNGDRMPIVETLVAESGYRSARTLDFGWNSKRTSPFRLRVLCASDQISTTRLAADISGASLFVALVKGRHLGDKRPIVPAGDGAPALPVAP